MKTESSSLCEKHFDEIILAINSKEIWALEMMDSGGKNPFGIMSGHIAALGNYDQCLRVENAAKQGSKIQGKYCLASIPMNDLINPPGTDKNETTVAGSMNVRLQLGVCVPKSCSAQDLKKLLERKMAESNPKFNSTGTFTDSDCSTKDRKKFTAIDWIAILIFSCFGFMVLACSIYDYVIRLREDTGRELFLSFSILSNGEKLFKMQWSKNPNEIKCLHGIRTLSMIWIVLGHNYMRASSLPNINTKDIIEWLHLFFSLFVQMAPFAVDSFFVMSGLLVSWIAMQELNNSNGSLNIPFTYFHRYLRLTPVYAALILFSVSLIRYCGSGPYWSKIEATFVTPCNNYWWSALLYVQNYANPNELCLRHSWYLSADTQLFWISPFVMICLWKWGWKIIIFIVCVMCASIGYTFQVFYEHEFIMLEAQDMLNPKRKELTYFPTHTRLPAWFVGLLLGYFLYSIKDREIRFPKINSVDDSGFIIYSEPGGDLKMIQWKVINKLIYSSRRRRDRKFRKCVKMPSTSVHKRCSDTYNRGSAAAEHSQKCIEATIWISSFTVIAAIILGPYPKVQPGVVNSPFESALYASLSKVSWAIAFSMIIFMCHTGNGGIINTILSLPFWQPISRLSYCIYLSHYIFQVIITSSVKHDTYFSDFVVIYRFWSDFAFSIMISIVLALTFESPIVSIEKVLFRRKKPSPEIQNKKEDSETQIVNEA